MLLNQRVNLSSKFYERLQISALNFGTRINLQIVNYTLNIDYICRGIGTRVGSPKRKQSFKTRLDPIGLQLGQARQTYNRLPLSNQSYRMLAVGPGAIGP